MSKDVDVLKDILTNMTKLGEIQQVKFTEQDDGKLSIEGLSDSRTIIMKAETKESVDQFQGVFGMLDFKPFLTFLDLNDKFEIVNEDDNTRKLKNGRRDCSFVSKKHIENLVKHVALKNVDMDIEIDSKDFKTDAVVKLMSDFSAYNKLKFKMIDDEFVAEFGAENETISKYSETLSSAKGELTNELVFPLTVIRGVLSLNGETKIKMSSKGLMHVNVDTGVVNYNFYIPANK